MKVKQGEYLEDILVFECSGKELYVNAGIVGICHYLKPTQGYDGTIDNDELTKAERRELAFYAISLWEAYIAKNTE